MEHSVLHALDLAGLITSIGGVIFVLGFLRPAGRRLGLRVGSGESPVDELSASASRWVMRGALLAGFAAFLILFVDVAEAQGKAVYSGVDLGLWERFITQTRVGRLSLARVGLLFLAAAVTRLRSRRKWWLTGAVVFGATATAGLVSHAAAQPAGRSLAVTAEVVHIAVAGLWLGVLVQLLAVRPWIEGATGEARLALVAEIVRRFSPVALTVVSLLALSGLFMAWRFLGTPGAVLTSSYGLTLVVKLALLAPALFAGGINHFTIRPKLRELARLRDAAASPAGDARAAGGVLQRFGRLLELEVTAGLLVVTVAGILASVSPPGEGGAYRLTEGQTHALLSAHLPALTFANPASFYGALERTPADYHYSEFVHNWSGVMVFLLGLGWLAQSAGGRLAKWAGRAWPLLLIPFAAFVAVASDPEIWVLRQLGVRDVLGDPQLFEHQFGAVIILALVGLGWRDRGRPADNRPLGHVLPLILVFGGLLLLGHAHSTLTITEQVTNLINVQHAIFGAFIVFAGTVRWLSLRGLFPRRAGDFIWPALILGLGLFMAFFYRELQ